MVEGFPSIVRGDAYLGGLSSAIASILILLN